jgi:hypothetical protein
MPPADQVSFKILYVEPMNNKHPWMINMNRESITEENPWLREIASKSKWVSQDLRELEKDLMRARSLGLSKHSWSANMEDTKMGLE